VRRIEARICWAARPFVRDCRRPQVFRVMTASAARARARTFWWLRASVEEEAETSSYSGSRDVRRTTRLAIRAGPTIDQRASRARYWPPGRREGPVCRGSPALSDRVWAMAARAQAATRGGKLNMLCSSHHRSTRRANARARSVAAGDKLAIGGPPVSLEDARVIVGAEHAAACVKPSSTAGLRKTVVSGVARRPTTSRWASRLSAVSSGVTTGLR